MMTQQIAARPSWRQIWGQLHWFLGISAGSLLLVIGLSGAVLAFREELLDLLNPGVLSVPVTQAAPLTPPELVRRLAPVVGAAQIAQIQVSAVPGVSARVQLAPVKGARRGRVFYAHPYTGAVLPAARGEAFFEWVEQLHRWLLLPRDAGRVVAGSLALCLLALLASGLYLRWPKRALRPAAWLTFSWRLQGRPFMWALHAVVGTWALPVWLMLSATGIYWAFDGVRATVDAWVGVPRGGPRAANAKVPERQEVDISLAWARFALQAPGWTAVSVRLPGQMQQAVEFAWLDAQSPHERARNRLRIDPASAAIVKDERFAAQSAGARALAAIYPLHMGSYFGLPGRIAVAAASLALPLLTVTGWLLYLQRRRSRRATAKARSTLVPGEPGRKLSSILVAYASQSGRAERLAVQTAAALQAAGQSVVLASLAGCTPADLIGYRRALFVASTFGEGQAPDGVRAFAQALEGAGAALGNLRYALLALGNRQYAHFCAFGHHLHHTLLQKGAQPLAPVLEVCDSEPQALRRWFAGLDHFGVSAAASAEFADAMEGALAAHAPASGYDDWVVDARTLLNPGSQGAPLYELSLRPLRPDARPVWAAGDLVEILPRNDPAWVAAWLARQGLDGEAVVQDGRDRMRLSDALASRTLPDTAAGFASAQACVSSLSALAPRRYSIASVVEDGVLQLIVRQHVHAHGMGVASGYLTQHVPLGKSIALQLVANPAFGPVTDDVPCLFIGNGSGIAGIRSLLRARVQAGLSRNWLIFGERNRAHDTLCDEELGAWCAAGALCLDRVYSRDTAEPVYVQHRLAESSSMLLAWVEQGAVIYVCGSLRGMASEVEATLSKLLGRSRLEQLAAAGRLRRDVY